MLSPELLKKVERLYIKSRRKSTDVFAGEYASAFRGHGIEFEEFRDYVPGDDIRQIDWNVTARMDKPFVRVHKEEREQTLFFLVDASHSLYFGSERRKRDVAHEVAALLTYTAVHRNDKVGLVIFTDEIEHYLPPKKGRGHIWNIIATLLTFEPKMKKTNIAHALQFFLSVAHRKTVCFVISDFFDDDYLHSLRVANMRHEVVAIRVLDAFEKKFPRAALMEFEDLESGEHGSVDMSSQHDLLAAYHSDALEPFRHDLKRQKIDVLELSTDKDHVESLMQYFLKREHRK